MCSIPRLADPLSKLIINAMEIGVLLAALKTGKVHAVFKAGGKNLCKNYRQISLLSNLSMILEKNITSGVKKFSIK